MVTFLIFFLYFIYTIYDVNIRNILSKYKKIEKLVWAQEEPKNMGAWSYLLRNLRDIPFHLVSRKESAATASGSSKDAMFRQNKIIEEVFKI